MPIFLVIVINVTIWNPTVVTTVVHADFVF